MFEEYGMSCMFASTEFEEDVETEYEDEQIDPEELELQLAEEALELSVSQAQGAWLDGYLDAMDELEEEEW